MLCDGKHMDRRKNEIITFGCFIAFVILAFFLVYALTHDVFKPSNSTNGDYVEYTFRNNERREEHYNKHGKSMGYTNVWDYEDGASDVVNNPSALHKTEMEDGDDVYYVESTNEFVVVSTDGYIRTYFEPRDGIEYYNRQ